MKPTPAARVAGATSLATFGFALVLSACASPSQSVFSLPSASKSRPLTRGSQPSPTPFDLKYTTLDDPSSSTFNRILGINELGTIVGYYGSGTASDPSHGFEIKMPYLKFKQLNYPSAQDTIPTSTSTNHLRAGYFVDSTVGHRTWAFVKDDGIWTEYRDPKTPNGPGTINKIMGLNGSDIAVGFYTDDNGNDQPYELAVVSGRFHPLVPPGAVSAEANGINLRGDIVGSERLGSGQVEGWILRNGAYTQFAFPNATSTQAFGVNFQDQVVGSYVDGTGATHGYIMLHPVNSSARYWQTVDEPNAAGGTVLNGINSRHTFVGWYVDAAGANHGFYAIAK